MAGASAQRSSHVRVRYAETDQMGVVYYANYFVWFEVGRTDWLHAAGSTYRAMEKEGVDGLIVGEAADLLAYRQLIADLAARFRLSAIYPYREFVEVGGLMAYGVDVADLMRRVANMTGQVLGGAKVSDIPFFRQTKFELLLNRKAATSLGLEFPATLLTAADEVIE